MARPSTLSAPPQELVLSALRNSKRPLSAYAILGKLKESGVKSAPIIYRALGALMESGAVHKIETLNSFIACNCAPGHTHTLSVLTVCNDCEQVEELHDHSVIQHLEKLRNLDVRLPALAVIELPITCNECAAHAPC